MRRPMDLTPGGAGDALSALAREVRACFACPDVAHCHVAGEGAGDARVMFVAEAPGRRGAAVTGSPLTRDGAGNRFVAFLRLADLQRAGVFVTNAVLCNPLDASGRNRAPTAAEIARCRPFLAATIDIVSPDVIVALGRVALEALRAIAPHAVDLRGDVREPAPWAGRMLVAMYHPGRQSTLHRPQAAQEDDWRRLGDTLRRLGVVPVRTFT